MLHRIQQVLQQAGIAPPPDSVRASGGQRNETWICGPYVARFALDSASTLLGNEFALLQQLAGKLPVPPVVATGRDEQGEWMIQEKVAGKSLAHLWPTLDESARRVAVSHLAEITAHIHHVPSVPRSMPILSPEWLTKTVPSEIAQLARQAKAFAYVDHALMDTVMDTVIRYATMVATELSSTERSSTEKPAQHAALHEDRTIEKWGIIHGDLHFDNILWDGTKISAILDFEKACYAPLDYELDLFLRYCAFPALFVAEEFEDRTHPRDYRNVPIRFQHHYPPLFDVPLLQQRLGLYSLHYDLRLLQRFPPRNAIDSDEDDHLINRVRAVVEERGYLSKIGTALL